MSKKFIIFEWKVYDQKNYDKKLLEFLNKGYRILNAVPYTDDDGYVTIKYVLALERNLKINRIVDEDN